MPYVEVWVDPEDCCECDHDEGYEPYVAVEVARQLEICTHDLETGWPPDQVARRLWELAATLREEYDDSYPKAKDEAA